MLDARRIDGIERQATIEMRGFVSNKYNTHTLRACH